MEKSLSLRKCCIAKRGILVTNEDEKGTRGGIPGLVVGTGYLILDKIGMFDGPTSMPFYTPPSITMPDALIVKRPIVFP